MPEAGFKASDGVALREACVKLQQKGAGHVMVSMGREGAFFLEKNGNGRFETAPEGKLVSSVGSGDCMVAGFISMLEKGDDLMRAFSYGVCAGSASAFVEHFALRWQVDELFGKMR